MISVIIPVFNAEKTVEKALNSVKNQSWNGQFEIIIVDDGSSDGSKSLIETYRRENPEMNIIFLEQENSGVSAARNAALRRSTGEYVAFLDADDEWLPEKTELQMKYLSDPEKDLDFLASLWNQEKVSFPYSVSPENGLVEITLKKLLLKVTGQTSTALFKRKILENTGFLDDEQTHAEDANYWLRISEKNKMYLLPRKLVIAGGGKRSFGVSGLSADLKAMEKGIQKNVLDMYRNGRINKVEYLFYFVFSKLKYWIRPLRARL